MNDPGSSRKSWWEVLSALTPLILGLCVTGTGIFFTQIYNFRHLQLDQITLIYKFRDDLASVDPFKRQFAYASIAALGYKEFALNLIDINSDSAGRNVAQAVAQEAKVSGSGDVEKKAAATLKTIPALVYLQIGSERQRGLADKIGRALQQEGYRVPDIENVGGKTVMPSKTNVRYFNDQDQADAEKIVNILNQDGVSAEILRLQLKARPGSIEIWFSSREGT
ncbi:MAG: SPOR domain-containing protein [Chlorobaculum sp.]|nr:SPOR domain-containing protein [Chlorobaculum sp.]